MDARLRGDDHENAGRHLDGAAGACIAAGSQIARCGSTLQRARTARGDAPRTISQSQMAQNSLTLAAATCVPC